MSHNIPEEDYQRLQKEIASEDSPVGIDAKHTHILILHKLEAIERRLDEIEEKLDAGPAQLGMPGLGGLGLADMWDEDELEDDPDFDDSMDRIMDMMMETVENQLKENNPPATKKTLDRLINEEGVEEEHGKQMIATVLYKEMMEVISQGQDFNEFRYIQSLHRLPTLPEFDA